MAEHVEPEPAHLDLAALSRVVGEQRVSLGLSIRKAGESAGVNFMTLRRVEQGGFPDMSTYLRLCAWMGVSPETFFLTGAVRRQSTPDLVSKALMGDPLLTASDAARIASVVRNLYDALAQTPKHDEVLVAHLCAPPAMRRGLHERLGALLIEMRSSLSTNDLRAAAAAV